MADNTNTPYDKEIDFNYVSGKVRGYYSRMGDSFFEAIQFAKRNIIFLIVLLIIGVALGYYKDRKTPHVYKNEIFVIPNFKSVDYLYSKIDYINAIAGDSLLLKTIGINNPKHLRKIEIEPVIDIYGFINESDDKKFQILKLMADNGEISKILEDDVTGKNYKYHLITFKSNVKTDRQTVEGLIAYLNEDTFLKQMQQEWIINKEVEIKANDTLLKQIDGILNSYARKGNGGVFYNEELALDQVIEQKQELQQKQAMNRIDLLNYDKIIKDSSVVLNIGEGSFLNGKMKIIYPVLFILAFIVGATFRSFYKKQVAKRKIIIENE